MSTTNDQLETKGATNVTSPPQKRRGRKRKSEISVRNLEDMVEIIQPEETVSTQVSRRGRPRKKVNYYELANPENLEFPANLQNEVKYLDSLEYEEVKSRKKRNFEKEKSVSDIVDSSLETSNEVNWTQNTSETLKEEQNHSQDNGIYQDNSGVEDNDVAHSSYEINENVGTLEPLATTSTPKLKDKKYNYTGETVKMMNTLFTLFTSNSDVKTPDKNNFNGTNNASNGGDSVSSNENNSKSRPYRKFKKGRVKEEDIDDGTGQVTCAVCNNVIDKNLWSHHKQRYHNNLAWRVGDPPLDLSDQSFVMHTLNMLYKKKKPLYCDKCGEVKKSVVGFLSHQSTCRKSEEQLESVKIACELCGRKMLPVSMSTHLKFLHSNPSSKDEAEVKNSSESSKALPSKRSAAKKAMKIIENVTKNDTSEQEQHFTSNLDFGALDFAKTIFQKELDEKQCIQCRFKCDFESLGVEEALNHHEQCLQRSSKGFACKRCLLVSSKLEEIIYHIELDHALSIEVDDDTSFSEKGNITMPSFLHTNTRKSERVLFPGAFNWTYKFQEENFSDLLLEHLSFSEENWPLLSPEDAKQYLPRMSESCDVARIHVTSFINPLNREYTFKKYKLFESELHEDNKITLFCGGPVSSMSWLPTPFMDMHENQILAVSVLHPDDKYITSDNYEVASAIQFWNFGPLANKKASLREPQLVYALAHDHGPVWHMEWCPSGCYNLRETESSRMGLLAIAASDSVVYIYSIPFFNKEKLGLFYKPKPVMKLLLQRPRSSLLGNLKYYATKISWSKASGHKYIAVGYTNGFVAMFNLKCNSPLLKFNDDDVTCLLPYKCFQAHSHSITALALYHLNGGCRWLMSGSIDRGVNLWDLNDHNYPICGTRKNIITDGFWLTNWLCHVTAADEGSTSMHVTTMLKQTRDYVCDSNVTVTFSPSTISTISGSDWLNGMLHGNTVGEIVALFPHQLLQITEHRKVFKSKRMLFGYTYLIEKDTTPEQRTEDEAIRNKTLQNLLTKKVSFGVKLTKIKPDFDTSKLFCDEPVVYQDAQEKYGLLFCDNKMRCYDDFPKSTAPQLSAFSKSYGITRPNQYPMTAVNKVVFNPNRQASLYFATGYQVGFVRISWMEFLKGDQQIK